MINFTPEFRNHEREVSHERSYHLKVWIMSQTSFFKYDDENCRMLTRGTRQKLHHRVLHSFVFVVLLVTELFTGIIIAVMNCKEHHLPELELSTGQVREALQCILHTILL